MIIRKGFHIELINRNNSRIVFSASTDEIEKATFEQLWKTVGDQVFKGTDEKGDPRDPRSVGYYELRVSPIMG